MKSLKILSRPRGNAEEYGRWSVNPYLGCKHGCLYCYLKKGVWAKGLGGGKAQLKAGVVNDEHAYHLAMAEIIEHRKEIINDGGLFMTFTSDPCTPETSNVFFNIAASAAKYGIPVTMLTKDTGFCRIYNPFLLDITLQRKAWLDNIITSWSICLDRLAIGFTLTGHDELEPNASPNEERVKTIGWLHKTGFRTWASIEPVIDFDSSYRMIADAVAAGCGHFKIGLLTSNTRVVRTDFGFGDHRFKAYGRDEAAQFVGYVMEMTQGLATVYWKRSFHDFFGDEPIHGMTAEVFLHQWSHSVDKDWSMFSKGKEE